MEEEEKTAERVQKREAVLKIFLACAGKVYADFKDLDERWAAVEWFHDNFYDIFDGDVEKTANNIVSAYMVMDKGCVDAEAKRQAQFGSERLASQRPKQDEQKPEKTEKPEKPEKLHKSKKQKQTEAGSSSDVPSNVEPVHRAMSAFVLFLHSFVELSAEEQRVFIRKLRE